MYTLTFLFRKDYDHPVQVISLIRFFTGHSEFFTGHSEYFTGHSEFFKHQSEF